MEQPPNEAKHLRSLDEIKPRHLRPDDIVDMQDDNLLEYADEQKQIEEEEEGDDGETSEEEVETGLTENQGRMLYLIGLYARPARTGSDKEEWMRRQALLVMIYEGIVAELFDYDYAPASMFLEGKRRYFNKSQEGASDIDYLREEELVNGLKLSSKSYVPVTCYQISKKGMDLIRRMPKADKEAVHELVFSPGTRELLRIEWRSEQYALIGAGGYERISTVTEVEDVSYVSSAYVPQCLRFGGRPTLSNAHRAGECAVSVSNIRDELDEVITLNSVSIIVAEFIPFGANQIVTMNNNLGSTERVQGGFFTALIDEDSGGTKFEVEPGLTSVNILDYTLTKHVNFEADIHLPEDEGIVQVETFGVSLNSDGTCFYGMQVEAVMDRIKDNVSLDHLSRLLVDVATDSSTIVDSVISAYQRKLMNLVFNGDAEQRDKVNLIIANEITPHLTAEEYMDKGEYENELKQVIGDTRAAFDISEHDTLIFGENGLLLAGPNSRQHEPLLCAFLQFTAMDLFCRNYWNRLFLLNDEMRELKRLLNTHHEDPTSLEKIRSKIQVAADRTRLLGEILGYLVEALEASEIPPEPANGAGRALYDRLQIADLAGQLSMRVLDLKKNMRGTEQELQFLKSLAEVIAQRRWMRTQELIEYNSRQMILLHSTEERAANTLEVLQFIMSALLAFAIMDRLTGQWTIDDLAWMQDFKAAMLTNSPVVWFFFNLLFWATTAYGLFKLGQYLVFLSMGRITLRIRVMQRLSPVSFNALLQSKETSLEDKDVDDFNTIVRIMWTERDAAAFGGTVPTVQVEYDTDTAFLHYIYVSYNRHLAKAEDALTAAQVRNRVAQDFVSADVFEDVNYTFEEEILDETGEVVDGPSLGETAAASVPTGAGGGGKSLDGGNRAADGASSMASGMDGGGGKGSQYGDSVAGSSTVG